MEPSAEFKKLQTLATTAYLNAQHEDALKYAKQAVQVNPEIFASHSLLSEVYLALDRKEDSLGALLAGAHTKRDSKLWQYCAERTLELDAGGRRAVLGQAYYCFTKILSLDRDDFDARSERFKIQMELGQVAKARRESEQMLRLRPEDLDILRQYAELCASTGVAGRAIAAYEDTIERYTTDSEPDETFFSWSLLNVYLDLLDQSGEHEKGINQMRYLARWLLGRTHETFWDEQATDCEWDFEDEPRRVQVEEFVPGQYESYQYGYGLPLEIRVKLGLFRLGLFRTHQEEKHLMEAYVCRIVTFA